VRNLYWIIGAEGGGKEKIKEYLLIPFDFFPCIAKLLTLFCITQVLIQTITATATTTTTIIIIIQ